MPELPEVETVRRTLLPVVGRRVETVTVRETRLRRPIAPDFAGGLCGRTFTAIERRAKYLLLHLSGDRVLLAHLGMSGSFVLGGPPAPPGPHDHVIIGLSGGLALTFNDPRRFGVLRLTARDDLPELAGLGPDPTTDALTLPVLAALVRGRRRPVKNLLMDQRVLGGIGNIYANEILFHAGIRPGRAAARLRRRELARLLAATGTVLRDAIRLGGSSIADYRDGRGRPGCFQGCLQVYERDGEPCRRCGTRIRRTVHAGRSSFYCPHCQR